MTLKIDSMQAQSGRVRKEDDTTVNIADILDAIYDENNGTIKTGATINVGDIEIGAVELKDATTDTRAVIGANGVHVDVRNIQAGTNLIGKVSIDQTTANANEVVVKAAIPAGTNLIGKTGFTLKKISTNFTRPADTTAYAIGDAITNSTSAPTVFQLDLASIGAVVGQSVEIRKCVIISSTKQSILPLCKVYLSATTFTATNDNSALDIDDTTMEAGGCWFDCDVNNSTASNSRCASVGIHEPMILAAADTKLYGTIQANNAYVPVSGEKFTIIIWVALL
jgi:hypothetical protein